MKKQLAALLLSTSLFSAQAFSQKTFNDPNAVRVSVGSFHAISASAGVQVYISPGNEEALAVSVNPASARDKVVAEVRGGTLVLSRQNNWKLWESTKDWKVKVYVSYKNLDRLEASSGAIIRGDYQGNSLATDNSSGGITELTGTTERLRAEASSGGMLRAFTLTASMVEADCSSGGAVQISAAKELNAEASSGGSIRYRGTPTVRGLNVSSGGSVRKAE